MIGINKRNDTRDLTDTNTTVISLAEAVRRWTSDGQFMLTEVNHSDAYESDSSNMSPSEAHAMCIDRIEATLAGEDMMKQIHAQASKSAEPKASETTPAEPASE